MKYKVGDRVRIKSIDWYNKTKNEYGNIDCGNANFIPDMVVYCGEILTIRCVNEDLSYYYVDGCRYAFKDEMIEGLVEEETKPKYEDEVNGEYYSTPKYLVRPSGYQFVDENGNVINATKVVLEKKKKEYPKTYKECCDILKQPWDKIFVLETIPENHTGLTESEIDLFRVFIKLKRCRDAYWKIAGEEMGLGKPWKPDWNDGELKWCMSYSGNYIEFDQYKSKHHILAFPTKETRDAFYENFKELIEICKELL